MLPIVLAHAGVRQVPGGFVGVDVFFVISGFLITSIIQRAINEGSFFLIQFYKRRIVRILPALLLMILMVNAAAIALLTPAEFRTIAQSSAATAGFVSNIYFWNLIDYFDSSALVKPLLHTWSLGVEEQFYILYPLILLVLNKLWPSRLVAVLAVIVVLSFALSLVLAYRQPESAFYLLPSRAWELGIGGLVALNALPKARSPFEQSGLALAGLALISTGIFAIRPGIAFPAPWALLPCIGTALVIGYGELSIAAKLLSVPPVRWIGRVSYSLYLWHWPLITFWRLQFGPTLSRPETALLIGISLFAATMSYLLIERPFIQRFKASAARATNVAGCGAVFVMVALTLGVAANATRIKPVPEQIRHITSFLTYRYSTTNHYQFRRGLCFVAKGDETFDWNTCMSARPGRRNVLIVGDSHAAQYWRAFALRYTSDNVMQGTASGCRPAILPAGRARCTALMSRILNDFARESRVHIAVLAGQWRAKDLPALLRTIRILRSRNVGVVVIGPTVEYDGQFPHILSQALMRGDMAMVDRMRIRRPFDLDRKMARLVRATGARYFSEIEVECSSGECRLFDSRGGPFHFDYGHLTLDAARDVVRQFPAL
ncbi:conserved membrane hypothetical protein [Novosphingobium sp. 9U]|nr:conserved membrane hypothetical protein [Novosphingobium sp. 9U]